MLFIEYPKCTTCQKAKKWLDDHGISYTDRHIKENPPTYEELKAWACPQRAAAAPLFQHKRPRLQGAEPAGEAGRDERGRAAAAARDRRDAGQTAADRARRPGADRASGKPNGRACCNCNEASLYLFKKRPEHKCSGRFFRRGGAPENSAPPFSSACASAIFPADSPGHAICCRRNCTAAPISRAGSSPTSRSMVRKP